MHTPICNLISKQNLCNFPLENAQQKLTCCAFFAFMELFKLFCEVIHLNVSSLGEEGFSE